MPSSVIVLHPVSISVAPKSAICRPTEALRAYRLTAQGPRVGHPPPGCGVLSPQGLGTRAAGPGQAWCGPGVAPQSAMCPRREALREEG